MRFPLPLQQVYGVRDFQIVAPPPVKAIIADGRESRYQIQGKAHDTATPEHFLSTCSCRYVVAPRALPLISR